MAVDIKFLARVDSPNFCERLFAALPDVLFCIKDSERYYRAANQAFAGRIGLKSPESLLGKRAEDFFTPELASVYREQDQMVLRHDRSLSDELELVTNRDRSTGWYLATKVPLHDNQGTVIGLASVSRDLRSPQAREIEIAGIARVCEHIRENLDEPLPLAQLAAIADMSPTQLDRRMRKVYQLSTARFVRKARIDHAAEQLINSRMPITEIAFDCGYGDQTAFTRQFRTTVGMAPGAFREQARKQSP